MENAADRDKSLVELRALLASYEERLSGSSDTTPDSHADGVHLAQPLFLVNDVAIDLRATALEACEAIEAAGMTDVFKPQEPEPYTCVQKVAGGVFRVHPRRNQQTVAVIGPFAGPAPTSLIAKVQTSHGSAPTVRFHISLWPGKVDAGRLGNLESRSLTVPPRHQGFLVSTDGLPAGSPSDSDWSLVLATIADPPEVIDFAWADFSNIVLMFATESGTELRRLS